MNAILKSNVGYRS